MSRKTILPKQIIRRAYSIFYFFIVGYLVLVYKIIDIQIIDSDFYQEKIDNQNTRKIELNSGRGTIYDRNKNPLTDTKLSKIIVVPKSQILNDSETKNLINKVIKNANEKEVIAKSIGIQNLKVFEKYIVSALGEVTKAEFRQREDFKK